MKNRSILIQIFLSLSLSFSSAHCLASAGDSQSDSVPGIYKSGQAPTISGQANYIIARYVMGSGGVTHATSPNHFHSATAGETVVGGMQSANNWLFSGFWLPAGYGPSEVEPGKEFSAGPTTFELHQNYPNPFNPQTTIRYDLPKACQVTVEIFNVVGQRMRLLSSGIQGPGSMQVVWDGRNEHGEAVGSGIYLYRLTAHSTNAGENKASLLFQEIKKMLLIK